jgi:hypothetical protein
MKKRFSRFLVAPFQICFYAITQSCEFYPISVDGSELSNTNHGNIFPEILDLFILNTNASNSGSLLRDIFMKLV